MVTRQRAILLSFLPLLLPTGCGGDDARHRTSDGGTCVDGDGDGFGENCPEGPDCDDDDPRFGLECPDCEADPMAEGCPCDDPKPHVCYSGPPETMGVGVCVPGLQSCEGGTWTACEGEVTPSDEELHGRNGVDDDCNGLEDDRLCGEEEDCGGHCCTEDEVCLGSYCGPPGECEDDGDCSNDTHCVPGEGCIPYMKGEINEDCVGEVIDPIDELAPDLQCEWTGDGAGGLRNVLMTPIVAELDPPLDEAYAPAVLFVAFGSTYASPYAGTLVAIDGDTCDELWRAEGRQVDLLSPISVGDLDDDGHLEIVTRKSGSGTNHGVAVFDSDGELVWETFGPDSEASPILPTLVANLDGEGDAEVMLGLTAFDSGGDQIWSVSNTLGSWGNVPVVADVDLDGNQEVVIGNRILDGATGAEEANFAGLANGLPAIGDFDKETPEPEIAVVASTGARIQTIEGVVIFGPNDGLLGGSHYGGPPVVADFDGDGEAEFGAAGDLAYVVFDPDCEDGWDRDGECDSGRDDGILWEKPTQDETSGATGSSVFDFDADGTNEVVYNDECFMRIYDGTTGETRFIVSNSTRTGYEYPVIADVDGDSRTEFVVAGNDIAVGRPCSDDDETGEPFEGPNFGVRIWRDVEDRWAPSRRIWNQHAYSVTNVEEDGGIPAAPENNWEVAGLNNFRVNTQDDPTATERGVDLTVRGESWTDNCPEYIELVAVVANRGTRRAPRGINVGFYSGGPPEVDGILVCETRTSEEIPPGGSEEVACDWLEPGGDLVDIYIRADDREVLEECEEDNNDGVIPGVQCEGPK